MVALMGSFCLIIMLAETHTHLAVWLPAPGVRTSRRQVELSCGDEPLCCGAGRPALGDAHPPSSPVFPT